MASRFVHRLSGALGIAFGTGAGVFLVDGRPDGAAIAFVGAVAASLAAMGRGDQGIAAARHAGPDANVLLGEVLDVIAEPVLLVRGGVVTCANTTARALLGRHIVGEDVRVAIRHPAAADRLSSSAPLPGRPVELVGLGSPDQRWEMRTGETADGARIVHLIDQSGNYAAEKMRVDFVANASHELRTPLASILGFIETLNEEAGEDPGLRRRFLDVMFAEARRMQRLVEDLISLSRIEAEKYRLPGERLSLSELLEDVAAEIAAAHSPRAQDVAVTIDPDLPEVVGDEAQLSQLLHNLIGNAMKYGRAGTPVTVALGLDPSNLLRFTVTDEGEGIAPQHIPRLTERFYRVDPGRSRSVGGTGLGLAIVKHIVERHRGRLDIVSRVGVGTSVTVALPPADALAEAGVIKG
ncbi:MULTISPECIES: ATP-binding protein [Sphingomonas]|jgi:two-component system phosphate regulon sensor histidine kinase PhoR|uniref:histidine kinase n=1 Tax=Sphingomonas taxi TaxID=1549858 RepID=A0A097EHE3_9SPHN|nr:MULTISPECIES: ATP-binding protein [Sphingomonas]AIT06981.1 ATPase [Sphingomonas taxi]